LQQRYLIVNADDFGMSMGVNRAIARSHECGIVTSASLLVRWPAVADAVAMSRDLPQLGLGLHIDLGEWAFRNGSWVPIYEVVPAQDRRAVQAEIWHQLDRFRELTGKDPTHIDSHQHVHRSEPARSILLEMAQELSVPPRHFSDLVQHCGSFYGQGAHGEAMPEQISIAALQQIVRELPLGITELVCHPGLDELLDTMYAKERLEETRTLCDERIINTLREQGVHLVSFSDIGTLTACGAGGTDAVSTCQQGGVP
jgi:chitin disaccharide deacetylase